jgi:hyperosmotically inducible periplasmic protein
MVIKQIGKIAVLLFTLAFGVGACAGAGTTTGKYVDDSVITAKVKSELLRDPVTEGFKINVTTVDGVVHLTGLVDSEKEKQRAEEVAKQVNGAKLVENELTVK